MCNSKELELFSNPFIGYTVSDKYLEPINKNIHLLYRWIYTYDLHSSVAIYLLSKLDKEEFIEGETEAIWVKVSNILKETGIDNK
jgi:hypothetical protein